MARVTVEDCIENVGNRFALVILGAERARELARGAEPLVECDNKNAVTALREIAKNTVRFGSSLDDAVANFLNNTRNGGRAV